MIRNNLSTRPFYNEAAVGVWLFAIGLLVAAATVFNVSRVLHYSRNDTELGLQASRDEARATELRASAARLRASVDANQIAAASVLARRRPKSKGSHVTSVPTALPHAVPRLLVPRTGPDMEGMVLWGRSSPNTLFRVARLACASRSMRGR